METPEPTKSEAAELLPCPFCGGSAEINKHFREEMYSLIHRCDVVGPIMLGWTEPRSRLIEVWNTREVAR